MQKFLLCFSLVILATGCQPASLVDDVPSLLESTPHISQIDQIETPASAPIQVTPFQTTPEDPDDNKSGVLWKGDQMPIFLEVTQTTIMKTDATQGPTIGVGPTIYFFNPDKKILMLHSTKTLESTTELLVGVNVILQTPGQVYEKRGIVQFPSAQPALIQLTAIDAKTGTLNLVYEGETFNLSPGESRTFKQAGSESNASTVITTISNYGHLADIQLVSSDGSGR